MARKNMKFQEPDFDFLKACKPGGEQWPRYFITTVRNESNHYPVSRDGNVMCKDCGKLESNIRDLNQRQCQ